MMKSSAHVLAAAVFFAVLRCSSATAEVRVTGGTMRLMPRSDTTEFSGGARVEHSSFTMTAENIVSRESRRALEAKGNVVILAVDGSGELRGERAAYWAPSATGTVEGTPAYMKISDEKGETSELSAPLMEWNPLAVTARGDSLLERRNARIKSSFMTYDRASGVFEAAPLENLNVADEKHIADFRANKLIYRRADGFAGMEGAVTGTIRPAPATSKDYPR